MGVNIHLKVHTFKMKGPLKIIFEYPENLKQKNFIQAYYSWSDC